jgi:hypothetical protein
VAVIGFLRSGSPDRSAACVAGGIEVSPKLVLNAYEVIE